MDDNRTLVGRYSDAGATLRLWRLRVVSAEQITPQVRRLHFTAPDLKAMHRVAGQDLILNLRAAPRRPCTIRALNDSALAIDFAHPDDGAAALWAEAARPGDRVDALLAPRPHEQSA